MADITLENIGLMVKARRKDKGIREVAKEIDISTATLSRIENGKLPDLDTFSKLCKWLNVDAGEILGCQQKKSSSNNRMTFHFKADKTLSPKTATALANMILMAQEILKEKS